MDNLPMNPNHTPSGEPRARAHAAETDADRALYSASWALECCNVPEAIAAYRRAARAFRRASELRADAGASPGGTELDRRCVEWFRNHAEAAHATADRLESGDAVGA